MIYITNALSLNMFAPETESFDLQIDSVSIKDIDVEIAGDPTVVVAMKNPETVALFNKQIGKKFLSGRTSFTVEPDDILFVMQYNGPRLIGDSGEVPAGGRLSFRRVTMVPVDNAAE